MKFEGTFRGGVVIPDDASRLEEGTRVRLEPIASVEKQPTIEELSADFCVSIVDAPSMRPPTFGEEFGDLCGDFPELPTDLAAQHDHYRLGTPKR